jgi:hypothetical protein
MLKDMRVITSARLGRPPARNAQIIPNAAKVIAPRRAADDGQDYRKHFQPSSLNLPAIPAMMDFHAGGGLPTGRRSALGALFLDMP